ncbi:MAG: hypothetical protein M1825_000093 [Sarcosagium campestre]|nr:MAG: hypothetical protein M1825_000093 [Sarcosagium campestre]
MPVTSEAPVPAQRIKAVPLTHDAFAPFGTVIENPYIPPTGPSETSPLEAIGTAKEGSANLQPVSANQGTALLYEDAFPTANYYRRAPSSQRARLLCRMFVCYPKSVGQNSDGSRKEDDLSTVPIALLERHPFTTQTFIPLGLGASDDQTYLVIVAPTLPIKKSQTSRPPPFPVAEPRRRRRSIKEILSGARPPPFPERLVKPSLPAPAGEARMAGPGMPDLLSCRAFIARGSQAVTYNPGTWHMPMLILGTKPVEFIVIQYSNGVALEDCQEVVISSDDPNQGISAVVTQENISPKSYSAPIKARL